MLAQDVDLIGEPERNRTAERLILQGFELRIVFGPLGGVVPVADLVLQQLQFAVLARDLGTHPPGVQRRRDANRRHHHRNQRHDHHQQAVGQRGRPERQIALQQWRSRLEIALRLLRHRQIGHACVGEIAAAMQGTDPTMHLLERLHQQIRKCRMEIVAHHDLCGGGDELGVLRRDVAHQVDRTLRERHRRHEREQPRIGVRAREGHQSQFGRVEQSANDSGFGRGDDEQRVDLAAQQRFGARLAGQIEQARRRALGFVGAQDSQRELAHTAAFGADRHAHS